MFSIRSFASFGWQENSYVCEKNFVEMLTDEEQTICNDLGEESSEEDNEKQIENSTPEYFLNPEEVPVASASEPNSASDSEEDPSKFLYHPVMVSTLLNIDFENYMVHESTNGLAAAKQESTSISSCTTSSTSSPSYTSSPTIVSPVPVTFQHFQFHNSHREFFIVENRQSRPRSSSLTDNTIDCFRTRRDLSLDMPMNRSNNDLPALSNSSARNPLNYDMFAVRESVNTAKPTVLPQVRINLPLSPLSTKKFCDFHQNLVSASNVATDENFGFNVTVPAHSFNCARTVSFHALLCSCKLTCCCMCDFLCPSDCHACLHGVCAQFVHNYPCVKSNILAPIKNFIVDKVRFFFLIDTYRIDLVRWRDGDSRSYTDYK